MTLFLSFPLDFIRKTESISFPTNLAITKTNLIQFVLTNAQSIVKWQTSLQLCNKSCLIRNLAQHSSHARRLSRRVKNGLMQITLIDIEIEKLNKVKKRTKDIEKQLKELGVFKLQMASTMKEQRVKFTQMSLMKQIILNRIKHLNESKGNVDEDAELNQALINDFNLIFNQTSSSSSNVDQTKKEVKKLKDKTDKNKSNKTSGSKTSKTPNKQTSKSKSPTKKDEL